MKLGEVGSGGSKMGAMKRLCIYKYEISRSIKVEKPVKKLCKYVPTSEWRPSIMWCWLVLFIHAEPTLLLVHRWRTGYSPTIHTGATSIRHVVLTETPNWVGDLLCTAGCCGAVWINFFSFDTCVGGSVHAQFWYCLSVCFIWIRNYTVPTAVHL